MFFDLDVLRGFGDAPCLRFRSETISYNTLAGCAAEFAAKLPEARALIAIEMAPRPDAIAAYIGALSAGHAVLPLPVGTASVQALARFQAAYHYSDRLVHIGPSAKLHDDLALVLQTSGSTGQGQGVRLSQAALQSNAQAIAEYLQLDSRDRATLILPLHYSYGLSVLHSHLRVGASLWLAEGSVLEGNFLHELAAAKATNLAGVPHHFTMLDSVGLAAQLPAELKTLTVAGGAMAPDAVQRWSGVMQRQSGRFFVMYGQTEACARIAYLPADLACSHPDAMGRAIPGGTLMLRSEAGQIVTGAGEGELVYTGPNVMMGYASDAQDLQKGAEIAELATGDLAQRDADGIYRITGRLSRMSKIAGLRIGHDALERGLWEHGYEPAIWGDDDTLYIAAATADEALAQKAADLAGIGRSHIELVSCKSFPRRANGKIDYPALKQLQPVRRETKGVAEAFAQCFAPEPVAPDQSFADLGGDSLKHVELSLTLDRILGGLPDNWEETAIKDLRKPHRSGSMVSVPLLARVLAILAVVIAHQTNIPVYGGAAAMVILLGMSVADHRLNALSAGEPWQFMKPTLRVLGPYFAVLAGYALVWEQVPWVSVALLGNFAITTPETHLMLPYLYWFVEAYVQMSLLVLLLFWPPKMRQTVRSHPFAAGAALLVFAVALRVTIPELWPLPAGRSQFSLPWVFYLFALGWCVACAKTLAQRTLVLAAAMVIFPAAAYLGGNWYGAWYKYMGLLALSGVLLWVPRVPMPRLGVRAVMYMAQAAFPIYLLHRFVPEEIMPWLSQEFGLSLSNSATDVVAIVGGVVIGLLAACGLRQLARLRLPVWRQLRAVR